jgi:hypothetical protein
MAFCCCTSKVVMSCSLEGRYVMKVRGTDVCRTLRIRFGRQKRLSRDKLFTTRVPYEHIPLGSSSSLGLGRTNGSPPSDRLMSAQVALLQARASHRNAARRAPVDVARVCWVLPSPGAARVCWAGRPWPAPSFARRPSSFLPPVTKIKQTTVTDAS